MYERALAIRETTLGRDHPEVALILNNLGLMLKSQGAFTEARPLLERALAIRERALGKAHPYVATSLNNLATLLRALGKHAEARPLYERALEILEKTLGSDHPDVASGVNNLAMLRYAEGAFPEARRLVERALTIYAASFGEDHPSVITSLGNLAEFLKAEGALPEAMTAYRRALAATGRDVRARLSALRSPQRLRLLRSTRYRLDNWIRFAPSVGLSGYQEVVSLRGLVARAEAAERVLARRATGDDIRLREALEAAQRRAARLANQMPSSRKTEARATWQKAYAEAASERERLTRELTTRVAPLRVALERLDLGLADVQASLGPDQALVDFLRIGDRYLAWIVRGTGEPVRVDVGAADVIEKASEAFAEEIADNQGATAAGAALRLLVWAPVEAQFGDGVKRIVICPDAALAAVPFAALPGKAPDANLLDDLAISFVMNAQDLVPWKDAPPMGVGALLVGGVDYESADIGSKEQPLSERPAVLASLDRAPRGGTFSALPETSVEIERLRDRLGKEPATLLRGSNATESRLRDSVKGKRLVHIATHGFAREDLLAGLYSRQIREAWTSADTERQLAAGHDPMLLSGLAMAGANPREGAAGDDGILTALEASYLDLKGVELVTLSACETAKGTAEAGEGVQGLVSAFQMAGARRVVASLWKVDDEGTRRLMEGLYERMARKVNPLAPGDALREAALSLRDSKHATGKARFANPRYWAAFVCYGSN